MASPNFSRPRRPSEGQTLDRAINTLSVVSEKDEDLPLEPRFSWNLQHHVSPKPHNYEHTFEPRQRSEQLPVKQQRYSMIPDTSGRGNHKSSAAHIPDTLKRDGYCNPTMPIPHETPQAILARRDSGRGSASSTSRSNLSSRDGTTARYSPTSPRNESTSTPAGPPLVPSRSNSTSASRPSPSSRSNSTSTISSTRKEPFVPKSILKVTTVEQTSERSASRTGSSAGSNKSSSDSSNGSINVAYDEDGKFVSSEYDTSGLSEKEIRKMQKKGVNPALAMEMKALRKGKSFGSLVGNSYVS